MKTLFSKKLPLLYVVMHDTCEGAKASGDSGNPWHTLKAARAARARLGKLRQQNYYIAKYYPRDIWIRKGHK
jgi:hypothetical protein